MLITEKNTPATEKLVRSAAAQRFGRGKGKPWFEHGQWWLIIDDYYEEGRETIFSVVDAEPGIGTTGLDFEEV